MLLLAALAAGGVGYYFYLRAQPVEVPCTMQQPARFTPQCLALAQQAAARGDMVAMHSLVQYFEPRQPALAVQWTRAAARRGEPHAISRVLDGCCAGRTYTVQEAEALLPRAAPMAALAFRLGAYCGSVDMAAAKALQPPAVMASSDAAGLCKVALRYGLLRMSPGGAALDAAGAQAMLAECERRQPAAAALRREAQDMRQLLAREIRPVHVNAE